jgi:hypothetical protein
MDAEQECNADPDRDPRGRDRCPGEALHTETDGEKRNRRQDVDETAHRIEPRRIAHDPEPLQGADEHSRDCKCRQGDADDADQMHRVRLMEEVRCQGGRLPHERTRERTAHGAREQERRLHAASHLALVACGCTEGDEAHRSGVESEHGRRLREEDHCPSDREQAEAADVYDVRD